MNERVVEVVTNQPLDLTGLEIDPSLVVRVTRLDASEAAATVPAIVLRTVMEHGLGALPITLVDGAILTLGKLPTRDDLARCQPINFSKPQFTAVDNYSEDSSAVFPTRSRMHMNLIVKDVARSIRFYEIFLGQPPVKNTGDYAKFELHDPPINLALMVDPHGGAHQHFGIQVKSSNVIGEVVSRYEKAGFRTYVEEGAACCYAKQEKTWVVDPDGNQWEVFVTTDTDAQEGCASDCICYQTLEPSGTN